MNDKNFADFLQKATELSYGLIVVSGPAGSGKTQTLCELETAFAERRDSVYRIGGEAPAEDSRVRYCETFKQTYDSVEAIPEDGMNDEWLRWIEWKTKFTYSVLAWSPDVIIIDDLDKTSWYLSEKALDAALTGSVVVVSVEEPGLWPALEFIHEASDLQSGYELSQTLAMALTQWVDTDPETGEKTYQRHEFELTDSVYDHIATWGNSTAPDDVESSESVPMVE